MRTAAICADRALLLERYPADDVAFAYHPASGETLLLNFLSLAVYDDVYALTNPQSGKLSVSLSDVPESVRSRLGLGQEDCPDSLILETIEQLCEQGVLLPMLGQDSAQADDLQP